MPDDNLINYLETQRLARQKTVRRWVQFTVFVGVIIVAVVLAIVVLPNLIGQPTVVNLVNPTP